MFELTACVIERQRELFRVKHLVLQPGRLYALIGANGLGKSSLLETIASGKLQNGKIEFNTRNWMQLSATERSRHLAWIDNHFSGLAHLNTQEFLELGRFPHTGYSGRLSEQDKQIVSYYADRLDLTKLLHQSTQTLSDGERQRAGIARALIQETPIVLLDEPTSFLDYPTKRMVMQHLKDASVSEQKMILLASHDLEMCLGYCTDFLVIEPQTKELLHFETVPSLDQLISVAFGDGK